MISKAEEVASRALRAAVEPFATGDRIDEAPEFAALLSALEFFVPEVLQRTHPWWEYESLDGFRLGVARKIGPAAAEITGLCLLISDQTWAPIHIALRASTTSDEIAWLDCKLGEPGACKGDLARLPFDSKQASHCLSFLPERLDSISWVYVAAFGEASERPGRRQ